MRSLLKTRTDLWSRLGRFTVAFGICGPLTAPAAFCLMDCLKAHRPVMAAFYGASIAEWWIVLALLVQHFAGTLHV